MGMDIISRPGGRRRRTQRVHESGRGRPVAGRCLLSASLGQHPGDEIIFTTDDRGNTLLTHIFPAFPSVMTDPAGHLWVEEYKFPREDRPGVLWTVFDPTGRVLGFVETPEVLQIF